MNVYVLYSVHVVEYAHVQQLILAMPLFAEKTFTDVTRSTKFAKVFSLESFPLYGNSSTCAKH